jgi:Domain of unknown function DUF1829
LYAIRPAFPAAIWTTKRHSLGGVLPEKQEKKQDRSCIDHLFNFVIPKSPKKKQPERIVQAINRPSRESAEAFIYAWSDTREVREPDSKAYAVLNDTEQQVSPGVIEAFRNYLIKPVLFTHRSEIVDELAA